MTKRMILMVVLVGLVLGGIFGFQAFKGVMIKRFFATRTAPPQTVSTTKAVSESWQPKIESVGTLVAANGTDVAAEVPGIVSRILFKSGEEVRAGTVLLELDADVDRAQLASLKAAQALARKTFDRSKDLFAQHALSQADLDTAQAQVDSSDAQVAAQSAVIDKKRIRAPFDGRLGIRAVDLGQYLNPGTKLVSLQQLDPIYADFNLPQKQLHDVHVGQRVDVATDALPGQPFVGRISAVDAALDTSTRNLKVRAEIANPKHQLLPGMFVTAVIATGSPEPRVTLPQTAITFNPYGNIVFLVEEEKAGTDGKMQLMAKQKFVTTGDTRGDQIAVLDGLKPGDTVVTSGQLKLRNGTPIIVNNTIQPSNDPAPKPKDQ